MPGIQEAPATGPTIGESRPVGARKGRTPHMDREGDQVRNDRGLLAEDARATMAERGHAADIPLEYPERGGPPVAVAVVPVRVRVDVDTVIVRTDLGSTAENRITTLIHAHDYIPHELESLPREPAQ